MPKSKRAKMITLARAEKKGKEGKTHLIEEIRKCVEEYKFLYTFTIHNSRNSLLKQVRNRFNTSRFFFGKNKVMQIALGRTPESELKSNLHSVAQNLFGDCGLLFTNDAESEIVGYFKEYSAKDYARSGFVPSETISLEAGPCPQFSFSMEAYLRTQLSMPTSLKNGAVNLEKPFTVCTAGVPLTPEQARILKLMGTQISDFRFELTGLWADSKFKLLKSSGSSNGQSAKHKDEDEDDDDDDEEVEDAENDEDEDDDDE